MTARVIWYLTLLFKLFFKYQMTTRVMKYLIRNFRNNLLRYHILNNFRY